jgi:hypothetical protein
MTQADEPTDTNPTPRVIIESPYAGNINRNTKYAQACLLDCLNRGEAPFASHLLYTQVLDDNNEDQRRWGIEASLSWLTVADLVAVYTDLGVSNGMKYGIEQASQALIRIEFRELSTDIMSNLENLE